MGYVLLGLRMSWIYYVCAILIVILIKWKHNTKTGILFGYMFLVFASTVLRRGATNVANIDLKPLRYFTITANTLRVDNLQQFAANTIMFVPVGMLMTAVMQKWSVVFCCLFSVFIETSQFILHRGFCETDDVISNTIGAIIGVGFYYIAIGFKQRFLSFYLDYQKEKHS